ncbi:hypothetical protein Noda2021_09130 [Candidatus Dependentiae bacterium Noda2021]|nr:hypothetical protein Noda2021_09130 [Candidatus Dependentiae bacterium Noda2021]
MNFKKIFALACIISSLGLKAAEQDLSKYLSAIDKVNFKIRKLTNNTSKALLLEADENGSFNGSKVLIINPGSTLSNITIKTALAGFHSAGVKHSTGVKISIYDADKQTKLGMLTTLLVSRIAGRAFWAADQWSIRPDVISVNLEIPYYNEITWQHNVDLVNQNADINIVLEFNGDKLEDSTIDVLAVSR